MQVFDRVSRRWQADRGRARFGRSLPEKAQEGGLWVGADQVRSQTNGVEFKRHKTSDEASLLGSLVYKPVGFDFENVKEIQLSKRILRNYSSSLHLFKLDGESNAAIYIDYYRYLNMVTFDHLGQVIGQETNLFSNLQIFKMKAIKLRDIYAIYVEISPSTSCYFMAQSISLCDSNGPIVKACY